MKPLNKEDIKKERGDRIKEIEQLINSFIDLHKKIISLFRENLFCNIMINSNLNKYSTYFNNLLTIAEGLRDKEKVKSLGFENAFSEICARLLDTLAGLKLKQIAFNNDFARDTNLIKEFDDKLRTLNKEASEVTNELIEKL